MNDTKNPAVGASARGGDASRRQQLIEVTLESLAEVGIQGTTLAQIAGKADVSPGLVAHYFVDKDGLLQAAFRELLTRLREQTRWRLTAAGSPLDRLRAYIEASLSPECLRSADSRAWLAYWSQVHSSPGIARIQRIYQRRIESNLRAVLRPLVPKVSLAGHAANIAALIDGAWLQGDENSARGTGTVDLGQFTASVILRMPIQDLRLAPYGFVGGGVTTGASTMGSAHLGAGLEYRIVPNQIGLFGDTRWTYYGDRFSRADVNNFQFRAGMKFVF